MPKHPPVQVKCFWCHSNLELITEDDAVDIDPLLPVVETYAGYDHCPNCESQWEGKITAIEVVEQPCSKGQPPIDSEGRFYPTRSRVAIAPPMYVALMAAASPKPSAKAVAETLLKREFLVPPQSFNVLCELLQNAGSLIDAALTSTNSNAIH